MAIDPEMIRVVEGVLHTYQNLPSEELAERVINAVHAWDECQEARERYHALLREGQQSPRFVPAVNTCVDCGGTGVIR